MVRILVGTLIEVGSGKRKSEEIMEILEKRDRRYAGKTAPGQGLYLWQVLY
jgi:tRNA pseudouridine38-40 synthase